MRGAPTHQGHIVHEAAHCPAGQVEAEAIWELWLAQQGQAAHAANGWLRQRVPSRPGSPGPAPRVTADHVLRVEGQGQDRSRAAALYAPGVLEPPAPAPSALPASSTWRPMAAHHGGRRRSIASPGGLLLGNAKAGRASASKKKAAERSARRPEGARQQRYPPHVERVRPDGIAAPCPLGTAQ